MTSPGPSRVTKTNEEQRPRGGSPGEFDPGSGPGRPPACRRLVAGGALAAESPPNFGATGGTIGGVSLKQRTRATQKTESPRRGPRGRGRGGGLGGPSGGAVLVGMGFMMAIEGTAARAPPGRGNHRGGPSRPPAPREPFTRRGGGGRGEQVRRGDAAGPWARGEREVGDRSRGGIPAGPGGWCPGAGARSGRTGWGSGRGREGEAT